MASEISQFDRPELSAPHASMTESPPEDRCRKLRQFYRCPGCSGRGDCRAGDHNPRPPPPKPRKVKMVESPEAKAVEDKTRVPVGDPDYIEFLESREG